VCHPARLLGKYAASQAGANRCIHHWKKPAKFVLYDGISRRMLCYRIKNKCGRKSW
jgi:hypothetical protein